MKLGLHQNPVLDGKVEMIGAARTEPTPATLPDPEPAERTTWPPPRFRDGVDVWAVDDWIHCIFSDGEWRMKASGAVVAGGKWRRHVALPGHEDAEPASPWEDAAREQLQRITAAMRRLGHLDLPTPGAADRLDVIGLEPVARSLETAANRYELFRKSRRERLADERRART